MDIFTSIYTILYVYSYHIKHFREDTDKKTPR